MPVRPRRARRHRLTLDVADYVDLVIGPGERSGPFDRLHALFLEHRDRFFSDSWAHRYFLEGTDDRPATSDADMPVGCPGL